MTSSLFQEALADAKQLKEVAEQNAKNAIIDSVTPKIRKFIEEQLLEGAARSSQVYEEDEPALSEIDLASDGMESVDTAGGDEALAERVSLLRAMNKIVETLTPEESASLIPIVEKMRDASQKPGSAGIFRAAPSDVRSTHIVKENAAMQGKNKMYEVDLDELMSDEISDEEVGEEGYHMGSAHEGMHAEDEAMGLDEEMAEDEMSDLYESLSALLEGEDEDEGAPLSAEGDDEGEETDAGGADATAEMPTGVEEKLEDLESKMDKILDMLMGGAASMGAAAPEAEMPAPAPEGEMPPGAEAPPSPSERVYKVNESTLMRELKRLREAKDKMHSGMEEGMHAEDEGMHAEDEAMDLDEMKAKKMKNAMATDEGRGVKGKAMPAHTKSGAQPGKADAKVSAPFSEAAKVMKENRDLKVSLAKHAEAVESLRGQLTEMNLFNAKLLYVNRLLQNRDLTDAQRRNIVESLDRAQSLREVKLLYKGLSESIGRKPTAKKAELVSESVGSRTVGSSSRPLSSSGVRLNEAVEVHRWAVLAGIGSKS
jgi:hypothetical protein